MSGRMRIAHFGAFDHDSYGDLLFPHVAEWLFPDFDFVHVSPWGCPVSFPDAKPTISIGTALSRGDFDGVMLGGGDLLGMVNSVSLERARNELLPGSSLPSIWCAPSVLSVRLGIPLVWNAPGCSAPLPESYGRQVSFALGAADYISVRDYASRDNLSAATPKKIEVCPDTALLVSRMWPTEASESRISMAVSRKDAAGRAAEIAKAAGILSKGTGCEPEVLSLMSWHWQDCGIGPAMLEKLLHLRLFREAEGLKAYATRIGSSHGYIGNSLHGFITAVSYGRRAVLVVPHNRGNAAKYVGFMRECGLSPEDHIATDWKGAADLYLKIDAKRCASEAMGKVSDHAAKARSALMSRPDKSAQKEAFGRMCRDNGAWLIERGMTGEVAAEVMRNWKLQATRRLHTSDLLAMLGERLLEKVGLRGRITRT
jgi:hypothetical protein